MPGRRLPTRRQVAASGGSTPALGQLLVAATGEPTPALIYSGVAGNPAFTPPEVFTVSNVGAGPWSGAPSLVVSYDDTEDWLTTTQSVGLDGVVTYEFSIDTTILSAGTQVATLTFTDALCSNSPQTATVTVVVEAQVPQLALSVQQFAVSMLVGTSATVFRLTASNAGTGTMAAPTFGTVVYNEVFDDWITSPSVTDNGDGTYALAFTLDPTGGTAGSYSASVPIVSTGAVNTPVTLPVSLTLQPVASGGAIIAFDRSLDDVSGTVGGANPATQVVGVSSANQFALAGPTIVGTTYSGDFTGWATATIVGSAVSVAIDTSGIAAAGTGYATVEVSDANAALTATYQVFLKMDQVVPPAPSLIVLPTALGPSVVAGGNPTPATVTINNANGSIAQLGTVSCTLTPGVAWASVAYNNGQAVVTYNASALTEGAYTTTLRVASTTATNSPRDIPISLTVSAAPTPGTYPIPQVAAPPAGWTWDATLGYPTGSMFNTLASYRDADDGAMPAFSGTVYAVPGSYSWSQVTTLLADGTIVDGDVIEIAAGTVINNAQLPVRSGWAYGSSGFVQIRSSGHTSLPAYAYGSPAAHGNANRADRNTHLPYMATFRTATRNQSTILPQTNGTSTASGYWITGMDFFSDTALWSYYNVNLTAHSGPNPVTQNQVGLCPSQIVFDRCVFRETSSALNKIRADGRHISIQNCDIGNANNIQSTLGENYEGHGIFIVNTPGPVQTIGNIYSGHIGWFMGGSDPAIGNVVPTDGVNMWNKIWCPLGVQNDNDGNDYKNAIEHKTGRRWIHAFNDIRYYPYHSQQSFLMINKCTDQPSGQSTSSGNNYAAHTTDIAYWCNRMRNCGKGFFGTTDIDAFTSTAAIGCERIETCYNLHVYDESFVAPSLSPIPTTNKRGIAVYMGKGNGSPDIRIEYNTFSGSGPAGAQSMVNLDDPQVNRDQWSNVVISNNVFHQKANNGPIFGSAGAQDSTALNNHFLPGKWQFRRNYTMLGTNAAQWDNTLLGGNNQNGHLANQSVFVDPANFNYKLVPELTQAARLWPGNGATPSGGDTTGTRDCGYDHDYMVAVMGDIGE